MEAKMIRRSKIIAAALVTCLIAACWGQRGEEDAHTEAIEDCRRTHTLTNKMLHEDRTLSFEPGVCYLVPEQITVGTEVTLTIEAGVKLVFNEGTSLSVHEGALVARGTEERPITFTGRKQRPGSWWGVRMMHSAHADSILEHVTIEYGGATPGFKGAKPANLMLDGYYGEGTLDLVNVTLRKSAGFGLYAEDQIHSRFEGNVLTDNARGAAHLHPVFVAKLDANSSFDGNDVDVVEVAGASLDQQRLSWPGLEVPYRVTGDINLTDNSFVRIGQGARLEFAENTGVSVFRSRLAAIGSKDEPVVMTGQKEVPGFWRGVRYLDSNSVDNVLEHVAIRYAGASPSYKGVEPANLMLDDYYGTVRVKMNNVELSHSASYGLYAEEQAEIDFANNRLTDNERAAALLHPAVVGTLDSQSTYAGTAAEWSEEGGEKGEEAGEKGEEAGEKGEEAGEKGEEGRLELLGASLDGAESTWRAIDARYVVRGDILVRDDAHLTIEPGVTVAFSEGAGLSVYRARITARGTEEAPILFTATNPKPGYWKGIHLVDTSSVENIFEHVTIEYGGSPRNFKGAEPANLMFDDYFGLVSATLNHVTSRHSAGAGMHIEWGARIRSDSCSSIAIEDDTPHTSGNQTLRRACRG
jgi:hypothetical protein